METSFGVESYDYNYYGFPSYVRDTIDHIAGIISSNCYSVSDQETLTFIFVRFEFKGTVLQIT